MKKLFIVLAAAAICFPSCLDEENGLAGGQKEISAKLVGNPFGEKEEGVVLVKLSQSASTALSEGNLDTAEMLEGLDDASIVPVFSGEPASGLSRWHKISFNKEISVETAAGILSGQEQITAIQYNSILVPVHSSESVEYTAGATTRSTSSPDLPFNDFYLKDQWDMINGGTVTEGAVAGADVNVKDAWRLTAGDPRVIVAILDQGIAVKHSDLKNSIWNNTAEINGVTGEDDDNNGFIDDKNGYNFTDDNAVLTYGYNSDHGTHIAGTIAATNNNGIGVSSIAGGSGNGDGVRLMSCQTFTKSGESTSDWVAKALKYAADNGACIAQCSYGYQEMDGMSAAQIKEWMDSSIEYEALQYFLDPANANCEALETNIAVYSAGNFNDPYSLYPGAFKDCISVTAFCPDFLPGGYSNYGAGCDIAAPGGDLTGDAAKDNAGAPCMILSTGIGPNGQMTYIYKYGTSMACPHVSGVVALGASYALKIGKKFSREEFVSRLLGSARDIDCYQTGSVNKLWVHKYYDKDAALPGWKSEYLETDVFAKKGKMGAGAVDAWNFLMALEGTPSYMATPGQKVTINVGEGYSLEIDAKDAEALGIEGTPEVKNGILEVTCTKIGSGKIRFKATVGKDENGVIPELDYYKYISIVSRPAVAANGGWL